MEDYHTESTVSCRSLAPDDIITEVVCITVESIEGQIRFFKVHHP